MKAGVVYPQIELGGDPGAVKAFAKAAEDLGYGHIVIYDHVLGAEHAGREPKLTGPYKETDPFHEPLVTYAYLAGVTNTLELVTGVIILPQRQIPIWLGGSSEAAYDRAARIGDGFLFGGRMQTQAVEIKAKIEAKLTSLGETTSNSASSRSSSTAVATTSGPATSRRGARL